MLAYEALTAVHAITRRHCERRFLSAETDEYAGGRGVVDGDAKAEYAVTK